MYRSTLGALLLALTVSWSAFAQTRPQFAVTDLGSLSLAGAGLT